MFIIFLDLYCYYFCLFQFEAEIQDYNRKLRLKDDDIDALENSLRDANKKLEELVRVAEESER